MPHGPPTPGAIALPTVACGDSHNPNVSGWVRLHLVESATTVRHEDGRTLLTDGPFVDSKEYLAGLIVVEAANLDEALTAAGEFQAARPSGAIEVRPILDSE